MVPTRPLDGSQRFATLPKLSQPTPSQLQQSTERDQFRGGVDVKLRLNDDKESRSRLLQAPWQMKKNRRWLRAWLLKCIGFGYSGAIEHKCSYLQDFISIRPTLS